MFEKQEGSLIVEDFFTEGIVIDTEKIFPMLVMATMSSGKSTLINALLGQEILPTQNAACTAKVYAILDDDQNVTPRLYITDTDGQTVIKEEGLAEELRKANNDGAVSSIFICGQVKGVLNTDKALLIIDTPGPNNSADDSHERITKDIFRKMNNGLILYILNATQMAISDDAVFLGHLHEYMKTHKEMRILFVLNKVDEIDEERESIEQFVLSAKEYLNNIGFLNPNIIPVSALAAGLFKKVLRGEELTRFEYIHFDRFYELYRPKDYNMQFYAITDEHPELLEEITVRGEKFKKRDLVQAIGNTGIKFLEENIQKAQILSGERVENFVQIKEAEEKVYEVSVIGPVFAGKSTLVNSLLHTELLPSGNRRGMFAAARILGNKNLEGYKATCYAKDGKTEVYPCSVTTAEEIKRYYADENVKYIDIEGSIPLVSKDKTKLFLHDIRPSYMYREREIMSIKKTMKDKNSLILFVISAKRLVMNEIFEELEVFLQEEKRTEEPLREKVIFLLSKCDDLDEEKENVCNVLAIAMQNLIKWGVLNPALIPISAKLALIIFKKQGGERLAGYEEAMLNAMYENMEDKSWHYEKYAILPEKVRMRINEKLEYCRSNGDKETEALIHTGIPAVEEVIKEYIG